MGLFGRKRRQEPQEGQESRAVQEPEKRREQRKSKEGHKSQASSEPRKQRKRG
ncbi:hypothetical protein [Aneurinibacillus tyrosinisolvens]|uniref:hypothetical protein n=1 Tax=Aneurinibacillus tyrosinisolvens TaxID=1443435 RepID=UPI0013792676|nr:hypothetical protein [Aneurinibacillus tyrosinisolvens]